jgi:hypothetical protein
MLRGGEVRSVSLGTIRWKCDRLAKEKPFNKG